MRYDRAVHLKEVGRGRGVSCAVRPARLVQYIVDR